MIVRPASIVPSRVFYGIRSISSSSLASASTSSASSSSSSSSSSSTSNRSFTPPIPSTSDSASSTSRPSESGHATHHFIKLIRSTIGLQEKYKDTIRSLGLRRRHSVALHPFGKDVAGMILRVKELIEVRNVTYEEGLDLVKRTRDRSEGSGVEITGIAFGGSRRKTPDTTD